MSIYPSIQRVWPAVLRNYPDASITAMPNGQHEVSFFVAGHAIRTWLPVSFPVASPAYFWTFPDDVQGFKWDQFDEDARTPGVQFAPNGEAMRWWIYKPVEWNPNHHNVLTWLHQIRAVVNAALEVQP